MRDSAITGVLPSIGEDRSGLLSGCFVFQEQYRCRFMIADYQALARCGLRGDEMGGAIKATVARLMTAGFDSGRSICFLQSQVPQLFELTTVLNTLVPLADLLSKHIRNRRMTPHNPTFGAVGYPVTQVADILMFGARRVLGFERHRENIDLARQVGLRFNHEYGEVFQIPEPVFCKETRGAENAVSYSAPNREMIRDILNLGGSEARICAQQTLERVKEAMGMNY